MIAQFKELSAYLDRASHDRIFVVTDSNVDLVTPGLLSEFPRIVIPAGEENKNIETIIKIWERLTLEGATRNSLIINIGGGMVSDMGGFAASTFKRGIAYGNISTTLLAAVDAAIGGKTGINFGGFKNEIGAFCMPRFSEPYIKSFSTLPGDELLSGYGEMLKTGLLMSGADFLAMTDDDCWKTDGDVFKEEVWKCADFKKRIVDEDPTEQGKRKILNLGHTFGHAFESLMLTKGRPVPHGIAVAHGLLCSLILSRMLLRLESRFLYEYKETLNRHFPRLQLNCDDIEALIGFMGHDKKNKTAGRPMFVLLEAPGKPVWDVEPAKDHIVSCFEIYRDMTS